MANNTLDANTLALLHNNYLSSQQKTKQQNQPQQKKGNLFTNLLPAIGGGLGAVAGIPLDFLGGAGSIAGGAAGASAGEALKEKLLGQGLSAKQIGIQGLEGGATSAFEPLKLAKSASGAAKGFVSAGADTAAQTADKAAMQGVDRSANKLGNDLVTQGQSAQGRVAGISPGTKIGNTELTPQDQAQMLNTLKTEGINTNNANLGLRDVQNKLNTYGKQISDHFTANNTPLNPADTKTIAANYLNSLKTTDPGVLKQAGVLADDLEKNVNDTKSLWEYRKTLDDKIPDSKQGSTLAVSNKIEAVKGMRQYIAGQLGDIPGAQQYHDLSNLKPFVSAEAKRLNNPGGGIIGRVLASGPIQAAESTAGKVTEAAGNKLGGTPTNLTDAITQAGAQEAQPSFAQVAGTVPKQELDQVLQSRGIPVKYESDIVSGTGMPANSKVTLTDPKIAEIEDQIKQMTDNGQAVSQKVGTGNGVSAVELSGNKTAIPLTEQGPVEHGIINTPDTYKTEIPSDVLQQASDAAGQIGSEVPPEALPATSRAAQALKLIKNTATLPARAAAAPLAYPGKSALAVGKQVAGREAGNLANAGSSSPQSTTQQPQDLTSALLGASNQSQDASTAEQSPYSIDDLQYDLQRDPANSTKYIDYYNSLAKIYAPTASSAGNIKPTSTQYGLAQSGVQSLQQLAQALQNDPSIVAKNATPGQGLPLVGSLVSRASGDAGYHALADNILQAIIHLQTGATATKEETVAAKGQLPQPGDTKAVQQQKLQTLMSDFGPFLQANKS